MVEILRLSKRTQGPKPHSNVKGDEYARIADFLSKKFGEFFFLFTYANLLTHCFFLKNLPSEKYEGGETYCV